MQRCGQNRRLFIQIAVHTNSCNFFSLLIVSSAMTRGCVSPYIIYWTGCYVWVNKYQKGVRLILFVDLSTSILPTAHSVLREWLQIAMSNSFTSFLRLTAEVVFNSSASQPLTAVLGNTSADLDSFISAVVFAYFHTKKPSSESRIYIPLLNLTDVSSSELWRLRPEYGTALRLAVLAQEKVCLFLTYLLHLLLSLKLVSCPAYSPDRELLSQSYQFFSWMLAAAELASFNAQSLGRTPGLPARWPLNVGLVIHSYSCLHMLIRTLEH